jgi:hypothetical protein
VASGAHGVLAECRDRAAAGDFIATGDIRISSWAIDALSAASSAVSDIRQFCVRQPGACAAGSQAIVQFGHKAETGAKWLYQFLNERKATDQLPVTTKGADKSSTGRPSSSTLTPTDLAAPWHGPLPRAEAEPRRPS